MPSAKSQATATTTTTESKREPPFVMSLGSAS